MPSSARASCISISRTATRRNQIPGSTRWALPSATAGHIERIVRLLLIVNLAGKVAAAFLFSTSPAAAAACWFGPDAWLAYHLFAHQSQGLVRTHRRFATERREVWLTIDDGPDPEDTPRILQLLADHGARATFFVIGEKAARHPALIGA